MPLIIETVVSIDFSPLIVFFFRDFVTVDGKPRMLDAWHFTGNVASVQEILGNDGEGNVRAVSTAAVTTMASNQIILHFE